MTLQQESCGTLVGAIEGGRLGLGGLGMLAGR